MPRLRFRNTAGPSVAVTITKERTHEMWRSFLVGEEPSPTIQFAGICLATGARFRQHIDTFDVELDLPGEFERDDVRIDISPASWRVDLKHPAYSWCGDFVGRVVPEESTWLLDHHGTTSTLFLTLVKQDPGLPANATEHWWPGLSRL